MLCFRNENQDKKKEEKLSKKCAESEWNDDYEDNDSLLQVIMIILYFLYLVKWDKSFFFQPRSELVQF